MIGRSFGLHLAEKLLCEFYPPGTSTRWR